MAENKTKATDSSVDSYIEAIDDEVASAVRQYSMQNPSAAVPALTRGLTATRKAIGKDGGQRVTIVLQERLER